MTKEIWTAVDKLADKWRSSQTARRVISVMPRDGVSSKDPLTEMLAGFPARSMRAHALRLNSELNYLLSQPMFGHVKRPDTFDAWLLAAYEVEAAFRLQLAWLRAQLPGYPLLRVPQLVANTPFTTDEFSWRAVWARRDMGRGFQLSPPPTLVTGSERIDASHELQDLASALRASDAWQRLATTRAALTGPDHQQLHSECRALRAALSSEHVDEFEPHFALKRHQFREEQMAEAIARLTGCAAAYAKAFTDAADTVDLAVDDVLPQLVTYGRPKDIGSAAGLDFLGENRITFQPTVPIFWTGMLVFVSDPLVEEVGQVIGVSFNFGGGIENNRVTLRLLPGAAVSWGF
ncbi:hypothetical protein GCM10017576_17890 [Microbacterium barkeri]|uniref:Uncharacterized protein n=1 Tax=Microbacterium barkeri TaxID=33917 RepID=A0A9W6LWD0_9MICO|nr:hypothetical protein [Microbacterium barkeri]MDI6943652.1 hypothetical protein [Microbacterium barkeri]MDR6875492.1 hypothetical protein [Microbacterium barkeri]GLJ61659.1 hypothetical protein GCM10017576_17890 [Microbacterium barkeri]